MIYYSDMSNDASGDKAGYSLTLEKMPGSSANLSSTSTMEINGEGNEREKLVNNDTNSNSQEYFNFYCEQEILNDSLKTEMQKCLWSSCGRIFAQLDDLVNHVNDDHVKMEKETDYTCRWENCSRNGKAFNARYKMLIHVRTHTHEKPHLCGLCGKPFSRLENLKIHNRSHTGEKPYVCTVNGCYKKYSNSSDRFKHIRTHFVDKPYVCRRDGCDKRYTDPSSLRKHMKTYGHNREGTESTTNGSGKDKACTLKKTSNSQATQANGVKLLQIPVLAEKLSKVSHAVSQIPVLPVGVASLIFNPMLSSALTLKSESAKNVRRYMDTNQPFLPSDAIHIVSSVPLTDSVRSSDAISPKSQAGPLDLTVNQSDLNNGSTNGAALPLKWELSTQ